MGKIEYSIKFEEKVKRFIIGMLGQYGTSWDELTEIQKVLFETDVRNLTSGILFEAEKSLLTQNKK